MLKAQAQPTAASDLNLTGVFRRSPTELARLFRPVSTPSEVASLFGRLLHGHDIDGIEFLPCVEEALRLSETSHSIGRLFFSICQWAVAALEKSDSNDFSKDKNWARGSGADWANCTAAQGRGLLANAFLFNLQETHTELNRQNYSGGLDCLQRLLSYFQLARSLEGTRDDEQPFVSAKQTNCLPWGLLKCVLLVSAGACGHVHGMNTCDRAGSILALSVGTLCAASSKANKRFMTSSSEWPQEVADNDVADEPTLAEQRIEGMFEYDWKISKQEDLFNENFVDSLTDSALNSWQHTCPRIVFIGKPKSGKTWLLHELLGRQRKVTDKQDTHCDALCILTICCMQLNIELHCCLLIDSNGKQNPVRESSEISITKKDSADLPLCHALCEISDVLIYMVNQPGYSEQGFFMNLVEKQKKQNPSFTIVIVHNLHHVLHLEDFHKAKNDICDQHVCQGFSLKQFRDVDVLLGLPLPNHSNPSQIHVFLAQQCHELQRDNQQTISFLRKNLTCPSLLRGTQIRCDPRNELRSGIYKAISQAGKSVGATLESSYMGYRVVETQNGSVRVELDYPGYSKDQMDIDFAQDGTQKFIVLAKVKSPPGVEISVNPLMSRRSVTEDKELRVGETAFPNSTTIKIEKNVSLSSLIADCQVGTILLTFLPE